MIKTKEPQESYGLLDAELPGVQPLIHINGRFRTQPITGVQRFCTETVAALERLWPHDQPPPVVLSPKDVRIIEAPPDNGHERFPSRSFGPLRGFAWEQTSLPWASRNGLLVNLGNLAPLAARNQLVVIHDTSVYGAPESYSLPFRTVYRLVYRMLARAKVHIVTVSAFSRRELVRYLDIAEDSIDVIPEGAEHIHASPPALSILGRNGLTPNRFVLVVGSLAVHKNLGVLNAAAQALQTRGIPLVITGGLNKKVFRGSDTSGLRHARFIGRVIDAELRALYESACALVFPSRYEGFGLPAVEAMLCGCPVIAADTSSLPEICDDAAIYCDPFSQAAFTHTIEVLLDNPELQDRLRTRGYVRARKFTWDNTARALISIISNHMVRA